jgi:hypothetical protein
VGTVMSVWIKVGDAMSRRAAWWLLLACTVIGLASMHTLGHGSLSSALHGARSMSHVVAGPADSHGGLAGGDLPARAGEPCAGHGCSGDGDGDGGGGHDGAVWNVCLAVLAGLTLVLLPGWLLLLLLRGRNGVSAGTHGSGGSRGAARASPRARGVGLRLASVSVLRI